MLQRMTTEILDLATAGGEVPSLFDLRTLSTDELECWIGVSRRMLDRTVKKDSI